MFLFAFLIRLCFFYLLPLALFKTSLFVCAGGVTDSTGDWQDIRSVDDLSISVPFTYTA